MSQAAMLISNYDAVGQAFPRPMAYVDVDGVTVKPISAANPFPVSSSATARVAASFTRPADTTPYASGDLVADSVTAGSVTPMSFAIGVGGKGGMIRRVRLRKSGTSVTNAAFRLHLWSLAPVPVNGDNGVWLTDKAINYVGALDVTVDKAFSDGAAGNGVPLIGTEINFTADTYFGLLEARGAYTPASAETFELLLEVRQSR